MRFALVSLAAGLLLAASPALAALPPFHDSVWKLKTILDSDALAEAAGHRPIRSIEDLGENAAGVSEWRIRAGDCVLTLELSPLPMPEGMVGRVDYEVSRVGACAE